MPVSVLVLPEAVRETALRAFESGVLDGLKIVLNDRIIAAPLLCQAPSI